MARSIAITGASGFLGSALTRLLRTQGDTVLSIGRGSSSDIIWDPARGSIDAARLEGVSAVVHLAGASIAQRWTNSAKQEIRQSRLQGTRLIAESVAALRTPPQVLVSMSGIGIYGDTGDREVDEQTAPGGGFLGELAQEWEAAAAPAAAAGIPVAYPRMGVVLHGSGGALAKMRPVFLAGVGGALGSGRQFMPWISLADAIGALAFLTTHSVVQGAWNVVAPNPVTNTDFTAALARALHRPAVLSVPGFAVRLAFGQMGEEALLGGQRARPKRLLAAGYAFQHPDLQAALNAADL